MSERVGLDRLTFTAIVEEATALIEGVYQGEQKPPAGLKLAMVRALRKAEYRGSQAIIEHFGICDDCSPVPESGQILADATPSLKSQET